MNVRGYMYLFKCFCILLRAFGRIHFAVHMDEGRDAGDQSSVEVGFTPGSG